MQMRRIYTLLLAFMMACAGAVAATDEVEGVGAATSSFAGSGATEPGFQDEDVEFDDDGRGLDDEADADGDRDFDREVRIDEDGAVISLPAPVSRTPEEEEMLALREKLAAQIDAGELSLEEALEILKERAEELGLGEMYEDVDPPRDGGFGDDIDTLIRDFQVELDIQVKSGSLSEEEAQAQFIEFMIELGLIQTVDGRPVEPAGPPERPEVDVDQAMALFEEVLYFLAEHNVFTREEAGEQVITFHQILVDGEGSFAEPVSISMDQAELVYFARDFVIWFDPDEIALDQVKEELLYIAMDLGIIENDGTRPEPRPRPNPNDDYLLELREELDVLVRAEELTPKEADEIWQEAIEEVLGVDLDGPVVILVPDPDLGFSPEAERLLALRQELDRQVEEGVLTPEEAKEMYYQAAEDLGLLDADGTVVILPAPDPVFDNGRPSLPPEYELSPEEEEMMALLKELTSLVHTGDITREEAWERLTAKAEELDWDHADFDDGGQASGGGEQPASRAGAEDENGRVLLSLRNALASSVQADGLSSAAAFDELATATDAADGSDDTAIQKSSWGSIKAAMISR